MTLLQGKFKHRHDEKIAEAAAEQAKAIVDTYWKKNVFNPVNCCFYDEVKEAEYVTRFPQCIFVSSCSSIVFL